MSDGLESRLRTRLSDFEPEALLDVLKHHGFGADEIELKGHLSHSPQPHLLHDVELSDERAEVTMNEGLGSCRTTLPSYFFTFLQNDEQRRHLQPLLEAIDHGMLADRLRGNRIAALHQSTVTRSNTGDEPVHISLATGRLEWREHVADTLRVSARRSPATLHWMFSRAFPELRVQVRRQSFARAFELRRARVGTASLGETLLGARATRCVHGMLVVLHNCDHDSLLRVCHERMKAMLTRLEDTGLRLRVLLREWLHEREAAFDGEGLIGSDRFAPPAQPTTSLLFDGEIA